MRLIFQLLNAILSGGAAKILLQIGLIWLGLNLICWVLGAIGLRSLGRKAGVYPLYTACYPNGQIYYTLRLDHKERLARRTAWLIWWSMVLVAVSITCLIWAAVFHLQGTQVLWGGVLVAIAIVALMLASIFYMGMRMLEFQALSNLLKNKAVLALSVIGTIFAVPLQRVFLFIKSLKL